MTKEQQAQLEAYKDEAWVKAMLGKMAEPTLSCRRCLSVVAFSRCCYTPSAQLLELAAICPSLPA